MNDRESLLAQMREMNEGLQKAIKTMDEILSDPEKVELSMSFTKEEVTRPYQKSLPDCLEDLQKSLADVVCHPDLSDGAKSFLTDFCKVISEKASESVKDEKA